MKGLDSQEQRWCWCIIDFDTRLAKVVANLDLQNFSLEADKERSYLEIEVRLSKYSKVAGSQYCRTEYRWCLSTIRKLRYSVNMCKWLTHGASYISIFWGTNLAATLFLKNLLQPNPTMADISAFVATVGGPSNSPSLRIPKLYNPFEIPPRRNE